MDKLITTYTGKMPLVLEDLNWMDQSFRGIINNLFNDFPAILESGCILSGCQYTEAGGTVTVQAGYIYLNNEIIYFPGGSIAGTAADVKITYEDSYDAAGSKVFLNGSTHNVYFKRRGILATSTFLSYVRIVGERLRDRIFNQMQGAWQTPSSLENGWVNTNLQYKKVPGGIMLSGTVLNSDDQTHYIFTLPEGYRPTKQVSVPLSNTSANLATLTVTTAGSVQIGAGEITTGVTYYINLIIPQ